MVCVSSRVELEVHKGGESAVRREESVYAVRRAGEDADVLRAIGLPKSYQSHPSAAEVRVYNRKGVRLVRRLAEFEDLPLTGDFAFVSDSRQLTTVLPPLEAGDTLSIRTELRIEPFLGAPLQVMGSWAHPVLEAVYEVRIPEDLSPQYRNFSGAPEPQERRRGGKVVWTWTVGPILPPAGEDLGPPEEDVFPTVSLGVARIAWGPASTWEEIAASYWTAISERMQDEVSQELTGDRDETILSPAEIHLARVQSNVRYVSIQLGSGGKIPHPASEVLRRRYGDCKDMSTLLLAYLRRSGVEASLALVRTRPPAGYHVDPLPTLEYFNHAVVVALEEGQLRWLDATARHGTALHPREDIQGAPALVISGPARGWRRIAMSPGSGNRTTRSLRLTRDESGEWLAEVALSFLGTRAQAVRGYLDRSGDPSPILMEFLEAAGLKAVGGPGILAPAVEGAPPDTVVLRGSLRVADPTTWRGSGTTIRPPWAADPGPIQVFQSRERVSDVYWPLEMTAIDTVEVRAEGMRFEALDDTVWTAGAGGVELRFRRKTLPDGFQVSRSITISRPTFPATSWDLGRELRRRMIRWCTAEFAVSTP